MSPAQSPRRLGERERGEGETLRPSGKADKTRHARECRLLSSDDELRFTIKGRKVAPRHHMRPCPGADLGGSPFSQNARRLAACVACISLVKKKQTKKRHLKSLERNRHFFKQTKTYYFAISNKEAKKKKSIFLALLLSAPSSSAIRVCSGQRATPTPKRKARRSLPVWRAAIRLTFATFVRGQPSNARNARAHSWRENSKASPLSPLFFFFFLGSVFVCGALKTAAAVPIISV